MTSIIDTFTSELPLEKCGHSIVKVGQDLLDWLKVPVLDIASRWRDHVWHFSLRVLIEVAKIERYSVR